MKESNITSEGVKWLLKKHSEHGIEKGLSAHDFTRFLFSEDNSAVPMDLYYHIVHDMVCFSFEIILKCNLRINP